MTETYMKFGFHRDKAFNWFQVFSILYWQCKVKWNQNSADSAYLLEHFSQRLVKKWIQKISSNLLRGTLTPLATGSRIGAGSCCKTLAACPSAPLSCSGTLSSIMVGDTRTPSTYSSFILSGPSTDNLVESMTLLSIYTWSELIVNKTDEMIMIQTQLGKNTL